MNTLFLNPNSSDAVTARLRRAIAAAGGPRGRWDVRKVEGAPEIIAGEADNRNAEAALQRQLPAMAREFDCIVLMSSVDTGLAIASRLAPGRAFGFTRTVLAQHRRHGRCVQAVTFGAETHALYAALFAEAGAVESHTLFDAGPLSLSGPQAQQELPALGDLCDRLHARSPASVFLVGAVVLELASQLRVQRPWIVDPIADLLAWLRGD